MSRRPTIVMVTGATPGVGKTSLTHRLVAAAQAAGRTAARFGEDEILERVEFDEVVACFRANGVPSSDQLLEATRRYVQSCVASDVDVVVQDMLFPFLPSLLAWGYSDAEIASFFAALAERCAQVELVQIHLTGEAAKSVARAASREGDAWLTSFITTVGTYADTTSASGT